MKKIKPIYYILLAFLLPIVTFAQFTPADRLILSIRRWVDLATPAIAGLALLAFFWGLAKFIFSAGDEEKRSEGKKIMIWGIIALFVMVSIWGIVIFVSISLDVGLGGAIETPCLYGLPGCSSLW